MSTEQVIAHIAAQHRPQHTVCSTGPLKRVHCPPCFPAAQNWGAFSGQALADKQTGFLSAMRAAMASYLTINASRIQYYTNVTQSPLLGDSRAFVKLSIDYPGNNGGGYPTGYYIDMVSAKNTDRCAHC